jgi:hypothetical protein
MEEIMKGYYTAEIFAVDVAGIVYKKMKAKIFDLLESQFEGEKLTACKRIAENMISTTARDVKTFMIDTLGDWGQEVEVGGELTIPEACEAAKERLEIDNAIR